MTTNRELQLAATRVLTGLLTAPALPEMDWGLSFIGEFTRCYVRPNLDFELVDGQADSHQAVRDWAAHLGADVELRHGTTPTARAIVDGVVVKVWCAPRYRDDIESSSGR